MNDTLIHIVRIIDKGKAAASQTSPARGSSSSSTTTAAAGGSTDQPRVSTFFVEEGEVPAKERKLGDFLLEDFLRPAASSAGEEGLKLPDQCVYPHLLPLSLSAHIYLYGDNWVCSPLFSSMYDVQLSAIQDTGDMSRLPNHTAVLRWTGLGTAAAAFIYASFHRVFPMFVFVRLGLHWAVYSRQLHCHLVGRSGNA